MRAHYRDFATDKIITFLFGYDKADDEYHNN